MKRAFDRVAAVLALISGVMSIVAGGGALLGRVPGWTVIGWLPVYNFAVGVLAAVVVAPLIWRGSRYAMPAALVTLGANVAVIFALQLAFRDTVARQSMAAMLLRVALWVVIVLLMFLQMRRNRPVPTASG
jgi:hypothetical protein